MIKRMLIMLIFCSVIGGGVIAWKMFEGAMIKKYMSKMGKRAVTVSTTVANSQKWQSTIVGVGTLRAVRGVDISSEVPGLVEGIYFESGDQVESGTLLVKFRVDDEVAALASLQAEAHLAGLTYERDYRQLKEKTVAQATVDMSVANLEKAKAQVQQQEALIAKKFIRAPFAGMLGIRKVDLGQYINAGMDMVTLQALDPIYFDFYLPQGDLSKVKLGQQVNLSTDLYPDKKYIGKIWALNSKVDQATRNVLIRAAIDNTEKELLPGMYGVININLGESKEYITLPQTAITYNPYGDTVFVVKKASAKKAVGSEKATNSKKTSTKDTKKVAEQDKVPVKNTSDTQDESLIAEQRFVVLGPTRGDQVAIIKGLKEGEVVVTAGQLKLQNGSSIQINNSVQPTDDSDPSPHEYPTSK